MHLEKLETWQHSHDFSPNRERAERSTTIVLGLTIVTMVVEIVAGTVFNSMALLADGWHMATHVAAFAIAVFTYSYARKHADNPRYTFGTGKVSVLGGFSSAVALAVISALMAIESLGRFTRPQTIQFNEAIAVALLGLTVNIISAFLLDDDHEDHHHDSNLRAAYIHVLADALTSILAIIALVAGKFLGWVWLDAVMGIVGAAVILKWSYGLIRDTSGILLDGAIDKQTKLAIIAALETDKDNRVTDLHVWYLSPTSIAATISIVTHYPEPPEYYKALLASIPSLAHVLVEVNPCRGEPCLPLHQHL